MSTQVAPRDHWQPARHEVWLAVAVLAALAALAAFSVWGMRPGTAATPASGAAPAVTRTAPAATPERERERGD